MEQIEHQATIVNIQSDIITAKITSMSACANCQVKTVCGMSECQDKLIEIKNSDSKKYCLNQTITITLDESLGFKAVLFGYVYPLFLLLSTLFISGFFGISDIKRGICSIIILIPYYLLLIFGNKYFRNKFRFKIKETNE